MPKYAKCCFHLLGLLCSNVLIKFIRLTNKYIPLFQLKLQYCCELTTKNEKSSNAEKPSHQSYVRYWLWWINVILRGIGNSNIIRIFYSADMFSSSWDLMGQLFVLMSSLFITVWTSEQDLFNNTTFQVNPSISQESWNSWAESILCKGRMMHLSMSPLAEEPQQWLKSNQGQGFLSVDSNQSCFSRLLLLLTQALCYCAIVNDYQEQETLLFSNWKPNHDIWI